MDKHLTELVSGLRTHPSGDLDALRAAAARAGVELPRDYLEFMARSDGGEGDLGSTWIELWPVDEILDAATHEPRYADVLLFAGNGANTIYGFNAAADGEIVEGDWIGLNRHELIRHGTSFSEFLEALTRA